MLSSALWIELIHFVAELPPLELEYKLHNVKYAVSMGRTNDPNSGSSEFAIMLVNNTIVNGVRPPRFVCLFVCLF
jgi:cyclophilin family peptidyl-prolyl cis-trans isomerase